MTFNSLTIIQKYLCHNKNDQYNNTPVIQKQEKRLQ